MKNFNYKLSVMRYRLRATKIAFCFLLSAFCFLFFSCQKEYVCDVKNPKTDLPWLKESIDRVEYDAQGGFSHYVKIYQCSYRDGTGFLYESNLGSSFVNCEGVHLCGSNIGINPQFKSCSEFNISKKRKLIYHHKP